MAMVREKSLKTKTETLGLTFHPVDHVLKNILSGILLNIFFFQFSLNFKLSWSYSYLIQTPIFLFLGPWRITPSPGFGHLGHPGTKQRGEWIIKPLCLYYTFVQKILATMFDLSDLLC